MPRQPRRSNPSVVLVGHGRMAGLLARAWRSHSVAFRRVRGRSLVGGTFVRKGPAATVLVLAVVDRALPDVVLGLRASRQVCKGDVVVHLAGILGPDVLGPLREDGAAVGAVHPLIAVARASNPPDPSGKVATFEGDPAALRAIRAIFGPVGLRVIAARTVDRSAYHAAAALCATGGVALAQAAAAVFARAMTPRPGAAILGALTASLLESVAHNVRVAGPTGALASPLVRGDVGSVERHLAALALHPRARELYAAALAQVIERLAAEGTLPAETLRAARRVVGG